MKDDGKLTKMVRLGCWLIGIPCLVGSAKLSVAGVNLGGDLWWMGWVIAAAFTLSQFIVNRSYERELNWTILTLGVGSYVASIWMNVLGLYDYRSGGTVSADFWYVLSNFDVGIILLGIFIDAFPEMALSYALGESRVGDFIGNGIKTWQHPEMLTKSFAIAEVIDKRENRQQQLRKQYQPQNHRPADMDDEEEEQVPQRPHPTQVPNKFAIQQRKVQHSGR